MSNKFCRFLSNGYKIDVSHDSQLLWSPCCFYNKKTPLLDHKAFSAELEYTNSATGWLPECATCKQMETTEVLQLSPRLLSFRRQPQEQENSTCGVLEISFDTACNAACLSCGSYISDTWKKYEYKHNIKDIGPIVNHGDRLLSQLIETVPMDQLQEIYIMGGEPFYSDTGLKLLKHLHHVHRNLDQVVLRYQTNGSIIPSQETKQLWKSFKRIDFNMSLDGIGKRFQYLRWPLKWHKIEQTLNDILETTNATIAVNCTLNPLNVLYFQELEDWLTCCVPQDRLSWSEYPVRPNRCFMPLDLTYTTPALRKHITEQYGPEHRVSKMFSNLEFDKNYEKMFDYIKTHDQIRRLDWRKTFPDAVQYYREFA